MWEGEWKRGGGGRSDIIIAYNSTLLMVRPTVRDRLDQTVNNKQREFLLRL